MFKMPKEKKRKCEGDEDNKKMSVRKNHRHMSDKIDREKEEKRNYQCHPVAFEENNKKFQGIGKGTDLINGEAKDKHNIKRRRTEKGISRKESEKIKEGKNKKEECINSKRFMSDKAICCYRSGKKIMEISDVSRLSMRVDMGENSVRDDETIAVGCREKKRKMSIERNILCDKVSINEENVMNMKRSRTDDLSDLSRHVINGYGCKLHEKQKKKNSEEVAEIEGSQETAEDNWMEGKEVIKGVKEKVKEEKKRRNEYQTKKQTVKRWSNKIEFFLSEPLHMWNRHKQQSIDETKIKITNNVCFYKFRNNLNMVRKFIFPFFKYGNKHIAKQQAEVLKMHMHNCPYCLNGILCNYVEQHYLPC